MRFEDLNWMDVESYLKSDDRLMLVVGACEEHGYLSLLTDIKIPLALADAASERTHVLVAVGDGVGLAMLVCVAVGGTGVAVAGWNDGAHAVSRTNAAIRARAYGFIRCALCSHPLAGGVVGLSQVKPASMMHRSHRSPLGVLAKRTTPQLGLGESQGSAISLPFH